ncbi:MAG TPA: YhdH/YhfP family quinone oxidoreductase [Planctomycetaceae bacterium]|nr:YhdH/YhfP family quinone oxidoreductase [Planctomycetaceae bacterium]
MSDFTCYVVEKDSHDQIRSGLGRRNLSDLLDDEVLIRVAYSSLNYKDALAATGRPGVARKFPHVPGIDAAGEVAESTSPDIQKGQKVLVTGYDLGAGRWGGWSEYARVPAEWVIPLPQGLSLVSAMQLGTAGFTAALSVDALKRHEITAQSGEIVVTGATGGVGCLAVAMLAKLGYTVVAVTGKADRHDWLKQLGAARVIGRGEVDVKGGNPLLKAVWAGAVDTVGGNVLPTLLRSTHIGGCVTACGLVAGPELVTTVFPFILRGVTLCGIDTGWCKRERRLELWRRMAGEWKPDRLAEVSTEIALKDVDEPVQRILAGGIVGRTVVRISG